MANKVLSIKMDEKDIERLKKYYKALVEVGFLSSEMVSLNAFYKHLLLDYLEDDICRAFSAYSEYGMSPTCLDPDSLNDNEFFPLSNIYNLNLEMFELYKKCVKEACIRNIDRMRENARLFNEVVKSEIIVTDGWMYEMECNPWNDIEEKEISFWEDKTFKAMDKQKEDYRNNEMDVEIPLIENSSLSEEEKRKLSTAIKEYNAKRKQNYNIMQGRGMKK